MDHGCVAEIQPRCQPTPVASHVLDDESAGRLVGSSSLTGHSHAINRITAATLARGKKNLFAVRRPGKSAQAPIAVGKYSVVSRGIHGRSEERRVADEGTVT